MLVLSSNNEWLDPKSTLPFRGDASCRCEGGYEGIQEKLGMGEG